MFNSNHYIPILKWKRAEQGALMALNEDGKQYFTPLIQFVMPKAKPEDKLEDIVTAFEEQLEEIPDKLIKVCGIAPVFIDVSLLFTTALKIKTLYKLIKSVDSLGGKAIPVMHLKDDQDIKSMVCTLAKEVGCGFCIRLVCTDFENSRQLNNNLSELLTAAMLDKKDIDILVDIKETGENGDKFNKYFDLGQEIDGLTDWRTYIFAAGSFPVDLGGCRLDEENLVPRVDWRSWKLHFEGGSFKRMPCFSDYTIQHPIYKDSTQFFPATTSIKYTLENDWLIMKGQKHKFELYLASAATLITDSRFYGEDFSDGDSYINEKAKHFGEYIKNPAIKGTGNTEAWLRAGINHHLELTVRQVASLS